MPDHASITPEAGLRPGPSPRNKRRWPILLGGIILLLQGCATTPSPPPSDEARTQAKIAYLLSDYQRTLTIVLPWAEAGEPWAQYTLGYMYYYGHGVKQDRQTAKRWIESAAAKGYAPAQQAMQRLSTSPTMKGENNDASKQEPAANTEDTATPFIAPENKEPTPVPATTQPPPESSAIPVEPLKPVNPQLTNPSPAQMQETTPPPTNEPSSLPSPTTPTPTPRNGPEQPPDSSPPPANQIPPQTGIPSSAAAGENAQPSHSPFPDNGIKGRDWISDQDPQHFTIQLISSDNEAAVVHFIRARGIEHQAAYYSTIQGGRVWYSVVYGNFPNSATARQVLSRLPRSLRHHSPRIRSFHSIHSQLSDAP